MSYTDPLWYKDAVFYELHVKAFMDSTEDGYGDFGGLMRRLDYVQSLGVDVIWLLPFYPSPLRDDGYDIADYYSVHPNYGTLEAFDRFIEEAHRRGLRVIADLVLNHTSDQHPWFQRARRAPKGSPERAFYVWSDDDTRYKEARVIFTDTEPSNWTWDPVAQQYYWHRFFAHQPDLNWDNPVVKEAMFEVMEYWLERGMDGFRADAVPYLIEREGTICENLPETHDILKEFRVRLEAKYPGRILLAEANQWPDDVRPYFGESDEFQMAFHFPLMPRIFMAVRQGIRRPIVEIIERTPPIPDDCQWCMFLRNHDELTLEMVTDEERDYMYQEYARDRRMRINLGIRRRLAPLMDNDRRKIELLNSILLTMPGSPIIYYGDEIGMGDNIYLGDRDGVRTPMQWSPDRNAGFSTADPARLYLPVIADSVYGYQAINVEAQEKSPFSLLNWMKRLIRVRKQHHAFGRGSIEFLEPENPHVLAYLRRLGDDVILIVSNLSGTAQAVQLDLAGFAGRTPVEMLGETHFLPIDGSPYALTLSPYGFFWFALRNVRSPGEEEFWHFPEEWARQEAALLADPSVVAQVVGALPVPWLTEQRWFRGKARDPVSVDLTDHGVVETERSPKIVLAVCEVCYADGGSEHYLLPSTFHPVAAPGSGPEPVVSLGTPRGEAHLYEALRDRRTPRALLDLIAGERDVPATRGRFEARLTPGAELDESIGPARLMGADQSNTSIVFDDRLVLKVYRKLEQGINPDLEVTRYLVERGGFGNVPALAGWMEYVGHDGGRHAVAGLYRFVPNRGDAWSVTLRALDRYLSAASRSAADPDTVAGREAVGRMAGDAFPAFRRLGGTTARMHLAFAADTDDAAFAPERVDRDEVQRWIQAFRKQVDGVLGELGRRVDVLPGSFPAAVRERLATVVRNAPDLRERAEELRGLAAAGALRTRLHGDYHLGQVLRAEEAGPDGTEWYVLDFEGEPARPLDERRAKQSPLRDVAGMLRSFGYAVRVAMQDFQGENLSVRTALEQWAAAWEREARANFLAGYREAVGAAPILPADEGLLQRALAVFELEKAVYELGYEANNRPDWIGVPLQGIEAILERQG